jgi:hypothetical protein
MSAGIELKALQLTIILLRQYKPELAKLLPGPNQYPLPDIDISLQMEADDIAKIIGALNELGELWLIEKSISPSEKSRNKLRQKCLAYLLDEWIKVGENYQQQLTNDHQFH